MAIIGLRDARLPASDDEIDARATRQAPTGARRLRDDDAASRGFERGGCGPPSSAHALILDRAAARRWWTTRGTRHRIARRRERAELDADGRDVFRESVAVGAASGQNETIRRAAGAGLN